MLCFCRDCRFFRPYRPLTQLIARDLGLDDRNVLSEVVKMMQDERQKQDGEAKLIPALRREGKDRWDIRPSMSDYCVPEADAFVVPSIRNQNGNCRSFDAKPDESTTSAGTAAGRDSCADCAHCVRPNGNSVDQRATVLFAKMAQGHVAFGQDGAAGSKGMDNVRETGGIRKSFEGTQTYYAGKLTFEPPRYLPYCRKYSGDVDFIPCVIQNPHDCCPGWTAAASSARASRSTR